MKIVELFKKLIIYLKEVKIEAKKVNWLSFDQTMRYTLIVVAASIAVAALLGGLDLFFTAILNRFIL